MPKWGNQCGYGKIKPEKKKLSKHDVCPGCGQSRMKVAEGESHQCPFCGQVWERKTNDKS